LGNGLSTEQPALEPSAIGEKKQASRTTGLLDAARFDHDVGGIPEHWGGLNTTNTGARGEASPCGSLRHQ
jgi:hypothetical protein